MSLPIPESPASVLWTRVAEQVLADAWLAPLGGLRSFLLGTLSDLEEIRAEHLPAILLRAEISEGTWYDTERESLTLFVVAELTIPGTDVRQLLDVAHRLALGLNALPQCADLTIARVLTTSLLEGIEVIPDFPAIRGRARFSLTFAVIFQE